MRYWKCIKLNENFYFNKSRWTLGQVYETDNDGEGIKSDNGECDFINVGKFNIKEHSVEFEEVYKVGATPLKDAINPQHYKDCSLECIDAMMMAFGVDWVYKHCILTAWKYMWRYKNKNGAEDIKKARWYIEKAKEIGFDNPELYNMEYVLENIEKREKKG